MRQLARTRPRRQFGLSGVLLSLVMVHRPTALLVSATKGRRPGKALDIGMGQGRNSIFLAQQGWKVTGFDPSDEGIHQAEERAAEKPASH